MTTSSLADTILEVVWIDGTGKVHTSKKGDPEFAAFNGGLGVFGVMTELLIQLTPPTNTQLITVTNKDTKLMADINNLLKVGVPLGLGACGSTGSAAARPLKPTMNQMPAHGLAAVPLRMLCSTPAPHPHV